MTENSGPSRSSGRTFSLGRRRYLPATLAVFFLLSAACHKSGVRLAYDSIDGATTAVQSALKGFNVLYQKGLATEADRAKARGIYEGYQAVALAASYASEIATTPEERAKALKDAGEAATAAVKNLDDLSAAVKARAPAGGAK